MKENPLDFSKRSRRAILIFLGFFIVVVLIPRFVFLFGGKSDFKFKQTNFSPIHFDKHSKHYKTSYFNKGKKSRFQRPPSKFDPNTYSPSQWMNLGMSQKQADIIIRFGKRGYYSHDDLKKVFVISDEFFALIKDSLVYPEKPKYEKSEQIEKQVFKEKLVDINTASLEDLMELKGIGEYFAKNIIKRRDQLGGFVHKEQLLELWKMDAEKLASIEQNIIIDKKVVRQFDLNTVTAQELKTHPYFTWNVANSIVKLRSQIGSYQKVEDIKRSVLVDDALFEKIKAYLTVE